MKQGSWWGNISKKDTASLTQICTGMQRWGVTPALPSPPEMGAAALFLGPRGWFFGRMERRHAHGSCPASSGRKGRGGGGGWAAPQFFRMVS